MPDKKGPSKGKKEGVKAVAEMLGHMDSESRKRLLSNVAKRDPQIAQEIESQVFTFEDLAKLDDRSIQLLIHELPPGKLALALRKPSESVKECIFRNLSSKARQLLEDEIVSLGPRRVSEVETAQREMIELAKRLDADGKVHWK